MAKTKKPRLVDVARYGPDLASLKRNQPKQWAKLKSLAAKRGVTIPALTSGAPRALQERTPAAIRRDAARQVGAAFQPEEAVLSRRERANAALAEKQRVDQAAYQTWLDGQVGLLRAQAGAADAALTRTHEKINEDLAKSQAAVTADLQTRMQAAQLTSNPAQSTALASVPAAQAQQSERQAAARGHSAELQKIGATAQGVQEAALLATASTAIARDRADQTKRSAELQTDRADLGLRRSAASVSLGRELSEANRAIAQAGREFGLAQGQLGIKRSELAADLLKAKQDYKLQTKAFNFKVWQEKNKVRADALKREIEYDKIKSREGVAAADRALRQRAQAWDEAHPNGGGGGAGGVTAAERKKSKELYADVETAKSIVIARLAKGRTERQIRLGLIQSGASSALIDVALDLARNDGKLSAAGRRKAKRIGILKPWTLWDPYRPNAGLNPTQAHGGPAGP